MLAEVKKEVRQNPYLYSTLIGGMIGYIYYKSQTVKKSSKKKITFDEDNIEQTLSKRKSENLDQLKLTKVLSKQEIQLEQEEETHPGGKIYKICLTGGPCAGKTSGLTYLSEKLQSMGLNVYIVPETATLIGAGGGMLDMSNWSEDEIIDFQTNLMKTQMQLESCFMKIATLHEKPSVVLCDRGLMDGSAYMTSEAWKKMLSQDFFVRNHLKETALRDKQYDGIIHLVTAADGAEEFYNKSNVVRYESVVDAIKTDRKLQLAWLGHPTFKILDNFNKSFQEKLQNLLEAVCVICGKQEYTKNKTKMKYLIDTKNKLIPDLPENLKHQKFFIEDTYVIYEKTNKEVGDAVQIKVRKRGQGDDFIYVWQKTKYINGDESKKVTLKRMMNYKEYLAQLNKIDESRHSIIKQRLQFMWEGNQYILDTYLNVGEGFSILECKSNENELPKIPDFIDVTRDISDDIGYKTKYLAKKNWYVPKGDERVVSIRKESGADLY